MERVFVTKLTKRLSLVDPSAHPIHNILVEVNEAFYLAIKKDNGAYLIAVTQDLTYKIKDQLHLINNKTGNSLGYGQIQHIFKPCDYSKYFDEIRREFKANQVYFYSLSK